MISSGDFWTHRPSIFDFTPCISQNDTADPRNQTCHLYWNQLWKRICTLIVTFTVISTWLSLRWSFCHPKPNTWAYSYLIIFKMILCHPKPSHRHIFSDYFQDEASVTKNELYAISLGSLSKIFKISEPISHWHSRFQVTWSQSTVQQVLSFCFIMFHLPQGKDTSHNPSFVLFAKRRHGSLGIEPEKVFGTCPIFCFTACLRNQSQGLLFWAVLLRYLHCLRHVSIHGSVVYK